MSNTPSSGPSGRKSSPNKKKIPITPVIFKVESIFLLKGNPNIVTVTWHDRDRGGKSHEITLYGKKWNAPDPADQGIIGKIASFRVRLLSAAQGANPNESERVGNIEDYGWYIDEGGKFTY